LRFAVKSFNLVSAMAATVDLTGLRFGRLAVISKSWKSESGHACWDCRCDCGCTFPVRGDRLRNGSIVSCGCARADPAVRRRARLTISAERRLEISRLGSQRCAELARERKTMHRAAIERVKRMTPKEYAAYLDAIRP
jgi:hypothetical protein